MSAIGLVLLIVGGLIWLIADSRIPKPKDDDNGTL
jgi:hypothetical protein